MTAELTRGWLVLGFLALAVPVAVGEVRCRLRLRDRLAALRGRPVASRRWRPRWASAGGRERPDGALPLATELLAACLAAGAEPAAAARAVGASIEGPVGAALGRAASELRLGGEPAVVWARLGELPGAGRLARRLELADVSGAPVVGAVAAEAADARAGRRRMAQSRARRAGVLVTAPLGLCFLPAFLLIGLAPVVLGLAAELV
ncbi:type II secretion system F family protein [Streptomyces profundus]|uniref:type II secretion system F family protein n=1 Tax=Streptomyces profundus TaxID=2867410 RepID=UPI001D16F5FF|nr:type II secretion system F family protein [Streptomyces sp. MA3_2.13]